MLLEVKKISEVSEFSILLYTQNRKLGNLGMCSFTSNFNSSYNLWCKSGKKLTEAKLKRQDMLLINIKLNLRQVYQTSVSS